MSTELMGQLIGIIIGGLLGIPLYYWIQGMINRHEIRSYIRECDEMMEKRDIEWKRNRSIMKYKMDIERDKDFYESFLLGRQVDLINGEALVTYEIDDPVALIIGLKLSQEDLNKSKDELIDLIEEKMYAKKGNVVGSRLNGISVSEPVSESNKEFLKGLGIPVDNL